MIRDGESEIIDHVALSVTNREEENKEEEKEIKEAKYSVVMPVDSVANYKSLAEAFGYTVTLHLSGGWISSSLYPLQQSWDPGIVPCSFDHVRATFFAGDMKLYSGKFIELILCIHLRFLI